ncbi:phage tail assembly chaperone [Pseudohoeflea suaedae]|uniref:Phage tail assembly chaperone n=1 Tax=Pseudohoeflea suaedae TaxID=877384 RepID=A0A4R5PQ91_9HYPH|nr:phage tail assembly chaperone [Pseudohoeflea suaedae]TDH38851.1 phage tail assembly chaperone [Pseudohoeflea suaedae]
MTKPHSNAPIPWSALMAFGLTRMRLSPETFWALSLAEVRVMATPPAPLRLAMPGRAELEALAQRYPDGERHGRG